MPKPSALPTDTFTITVSQNGTTTTIADAVPVGSIPTGGLATHVNAAPIANAGPPKSVESDDREAVWVTLNGSASRDPNGLRLSYVWTGVNGRVVGTSPVIRVRANFGTEYYTLTVSDSTGLSSSSQTWVRVIADH